MLYVALRSSKIVFLGLIFLLSFFKTDAQPRFVSPIAGVYGQQYIIVNYVDWAADTFFKDNHCGSKTYDSHEGTDFAIRDSAITTIGNGANNNVPIGGRSFIAISGPTGAFNITGIAGGVNGKILVLYNASGQKMTIKNNNGASSAANQIYTRAAVDYTTPNLGDLDVVTLIYSSVKGAWLVMSTN